MSAAIQARKICLLGAAAVGKTSLVARYVHQTFKPDYLSTVGVKVDTRQMRDASGQLVKLVIWELAGVDTLTRASRAYVRGAQGFLLVCDGTRAATLETALSLRVQLDALLGRVPALLLVNKSDRSYEQQIADADLRDMPGFLDVLRTSALDGSNVARAFEHLVDAPG